jgi:hypothetical protein
LRAIAATPDACGDSDMAVADREALAVGAAGAAGEHAVRQTASTATMAPARPGPLTGARHPILGFFTIFLVSDQASYYRPALSRRPA